MIRRGSDILHPPKMDLETSPANGERASSGILHFLSRYLALGLCGFQTDSHSSSFQQSSICRFGRIECSDSKRGQVRFRQANFVR